MKCGIYTIENLVNHKIYIGQSIDIELRWKKHLEKLSSDTHYNYHLQQSWNKYGKESFEFSVLEECSEELLSEREIHWITASNSFDPSNGYNKTLGGEGGKPTEETREKKRQSMLGKNKGRIRTEETKQKIAEAGKGRTHTEETKSYLREINSGENHPNFGKNFTEEHRKNMAVSKLGEANHFYGMKHTEESKLKQSESSRHISDQTFMEIYEAIANGKTNVEISAEFRINVSTISRIKNKRGPYARIADAIGMAHAAHSKNTAST